MQAGATIPGLRTQQRDIGKPMSGDSIVPAHPVKDKPTGRKRGRPRDIEREIAILNLRDQGLQWHQVATKLGLTLDATKAVAQRAKKRGGVNTPQGNADVEA